MLCLLEQSELFWSHLKVHWAPSLPTPPLPQQECPGSFYPWNIVTYQGLTHAILFCSFSQSIAGIGTKIDPGNIFLTCWPKLQESSWNLFRTFFINSKFNILYPQYTLKSKKAKISVFSHSTQYGTDAMHYLLDQSTVNITCPGVICL